MIDGKWAQTKGYLVEYYDKEPDNMQCDEVFRLLNGVHVSQYGRIMDVRTGAFAYTPVPTKGVTYAMVTCNEKTCAVHQLVAEAWSEIVGTYPGDGYTVDHINRDTADNRASNLRWATGSEQRVNQRSDARANTRLRVAVEMQAPNSTAWELFETMNDAAKQINIKYNTTLTEAAISRSIRIKPTGRTLAHGKHKGWSIRAAAF